MNPELTQAIEKLIDAGCHYRLDELAQCYAPDLQIVIRQEDGTLAQFDYEANLAFFRGLRDAGAAPLNTAVRFDLAEVQGETGYVIATRRLDLGAGEKTIVFTLMLRRQDGQWQVFREHAVVLQSSPAPMTAQQYLTWLHQLYSQHGLPFELTAPATEEDLIALTTALGHETEIPPELAALWRLTQGGVEREDLPFFQRPGYIDALQLLTPKEALDEAQAMQARAQRMWDEAGPANNDARLTGRWWEPGWLPFASMGGGSVVLMVDNHPGPEGQQGQVIAFEHDMDEVEWYAASFSDYLQASKASIENDPEEFLLVPLEEHELPD